MKKKNRLTMEQAIEWLESLRRAVPKGSDCLRPGDKKTPGTLEIWAQRIIEIQADVLAAAALVFKDRLVFFPSLAEILEVCREISGEGKIPTAGEAYEEVTTAMRRVGYYQPCPEFSHPAVGQALRAVGGWKYLCSSENSVSDRARFFEVYGRFREQAFKEETMPEFSRQVVAKYLGQIEAKAKKRLPASMRPVLVERKPVPRRESRAGYEIGGDMSEEEWAEHVRALKEKAGS
jgi:hypothetical protein